jgi:hypothetical protein
MIMSATSTLVSAITCFYRSQTVIALGSTFRPDSASSPARWRTSHNWDTHCGPVGLPDCRVGRACFVFTMGAANRDAALRLA